MLLSKDSQVQHNVIEELKCSPSVNEASIGVTVKDGAVTLTGHAPSFLDKQAAVRAAKRVKDVKAVADEMQVVLPTEMEGKDEDIAHHIAVVLEWNIGIPDNIKAEVRNGTVSLSGNVEWQSQKKYVERQIEGIKGIKSIINNIYVSKSVTSYDIKGHILKALHRHANTEGQLIHIDVKGDVVTLSGNVDTYYDMDVAETAAWNAPGVTNVVDHLKVA